MKVIAIIPARGGSKRLKKKNIYPVWGKPMIYWAIEACKRSKYNIEPWVSTEDKEIKKVALEFGAKVHDRDPSLSDDKTFKQAVIRSAAKYIFENHGKKDIVISLQANSPGIISKDLDSAIDALIEYERDEIISVDNNLMQNAAFRVFKSDYVFQEDLSTNCGVTIADINDIHTIEDIKNSRHPYLTIQHKNYYDTSIKLCDLSLEKYENAQKARSSADRLSCTRQAQYYFEPIHLIKKYWDSEYKKMICLGTRNNYERNIFRKYLSAIRNPMQINDKSAKTFQPEPDPVAVKFGLDIYSLDIVEHPHIKQVADYIYNFENLPASWKNKWDIIFSNSLDHASNATATFNLWLDTLKKGGLMLLIIDGPSFRGNKFDSVDCSIFDKKGVERFLNFSSSIEILDMGERLGDKDESLYVLRKI